MLHESDTEYYAMLPKPEPEPELQPQPPCVLVVEDDVIIRLLMSEELRDAGFMVVEAASADDALSYVQAGGQVDLLFSDIRTPGSMSGLDLVHLLRMEFPSLPVILTSGYAGPHCVEEAADVAAFVPKPYEVEHVLALVLSTLRRRNAQHRA
jgi:two-component system, response regulator PdtaR